MANQQYKLVSCIINGKPVEKMIDVRASLTDMLRDDYIVSIGASGAVFGIVGAVLYLVLFQKGRNAQYSARQIAWMAFLSLYGGFTSQGVDNAAHVGGFIAGFLLAALLTWGRTGKEQHDFA